MARNTRNSRDSRGGRRRDNVPREESEIQEKLVHINRVAKVVKGGVEYLSDNPKVVTSLLAVAGCIIIFASLTMIVKVMRGLVLSKMERYVNRFLGAGGPVTHQQREPRWGEPS